MKVFISWSGDASRSIAAKLYEWLPMVLQTVQPYMSSESIDKGTRWATSIAGELEDASVGIVVLTPENLHAPWIYFEAGALAKVVGDSKLAPLLCGLKPSDIGTPLSQFQVTVFNKDDVLKLLKSINSCSGTDALPDSRLEKMHNSLWADLADEVQPIIAKSDGKPKQAPKPSDDEVSRILEELLVLSRQQTQTLTSPEKLLSREVIRSILEASAEFGLQGPELGRLRMIVRLIWAKWYELNEFLQVSDQGGADERRSELLRTAHQLTGLVNDLRNHVHGQGPRRVSQPVRNAFANDAFAENAFARSPPDEPAT